MNAVEGFYPRYQKGGGAGDSLESETQILLALEQLANTESSLVGNLELVDTRLTALKMKTFFLSLWKDKKQWENELKITIFQSINVIQQNAHVYSCGKSVELMCHSPHLQFLKTFKIQDQNLQNVCLIMLLILTFCEIIYSVQNIFTYFIPHNHFTNPLRR